MKTKDETRKFLESLQWKRMSKKELEKTLQTFFETTNTLENSTDPDLKYVDYSFIFTNGIGACTKHFIDVEIWYLKMRNKELLITGTEILMYEE